MSIRDLRETLTHNGAWFVPIINNYFLKKDDYVSRPGYLRPSSIDECARANLYQILAVDEYPDVELRNLKFMRRGTIDHDTWYFIFKEAGIDVRGGPEDNTFVTYRNPNIRGKWDMIANHFNMDWLFEWKSTANTVKNPVWGHLVQWTIYSKILDIPRGFIVKQHPVSWDLTPIPMKYDVEFANRLFDWLLMIQQAAIDKIMLEHDDCCGPGKEWGTSCPLYNYCHSERGKNPFEEYPYDRPTNPFLYDKEGNRLEITVL